MLRKVLAFFTLLICLIPLIAEEKQKERSDYALFSRDQKVEIPTREISFEGQKTFKEKALFKAVGADTGNFLQFWKDVKPTIKEKMVPSLKPALKSFFTSEGFYEADMVIRETNGRIMVDVDEGLPVRIDDINISSDYDIAKFVTVRKGEVFRGSEFTAMKNRIIAALLKEGYCSYELDTKAYVDLEKHLSDIVISLSKGDLCTFGTVTVYGNETIDDRVIVSRIKAREGSRFDTEHIQESYDALFGLDSFDSVAIKYDRKFYNVVPVDVTVGEISRPWYLMGGVGYETNDGASVSAEVIRKNFMGNAKKLRLRLGYSKVEQLAELSLLTPVLFEVGGYYFDLFSQIGYSNEEYTGFMEEESYLRFLFAYSNEKITFHTGLAFENIHISLLESYDKEKLTQAIRTGSFFLAYPFVSFVYDGRDSRLDPKYGYYLKAKAEYGIPYDAEASSYLKYELEGRMIHTFGTLTLAAVAKAGIVDELENHVPESKYFFGGGVFSNRAYSHESIGVIFSPTRYGIEGASTMANLTLEANYPLSENIYGAVFTDNTMLNLDSYDFNGEILTSAGVGVRYMTPIGPIKLDIGMNVRDASQYGIHFQIGQSF